MRISLPNAINGLVWLFSLIPSTTATCNENNCLRALQNPTFTSSATMFCKTYTKFNNPYPTAIPKELKNCNGEAAAISSACSCFLPVATITSRTSSTLTTKCSSGKSSSTSKVTQITTTCKPTTVTAPATSCKPQSTCPKPVTTTITRPQTITITGRSTSCPSLSTKTITNSGSSRTITYTQSASSCPTLVKPTTCSSASTCPIVSCSMTTKTITVTGGITSCSSIPSNTLTSCVISTETITVPAGTSTLPGVITTISASRCPSLSSTPSTSTCPDPTTITIPAGTTTLPATSCTSSPSPPCYPTDFPPTFRIKITGTGQADSNGRYGVLAPISGGRHIVWTTENDHYFRLSPTCALINLATGDIANVSSGNVQWTPLYFNSQGEIDEAGGQYAPVTCRVTEDKVLECEAKLVRDWVVCGNGLEILVHDEVPESCVLGRLTVEVIAP